MVQSEVVNYLSLPNSPGKNTLVSMQYISYFEREREREAGLFCHFCCHISFTVTRCVYSGFGFVCHGHGILQFSPFIYSESYIYIYMPTLHTNKNTCTCFWGPFELSLNSVSRPTTSFLGDESVGLALLSLSPTSVC